MSQKITGNPVPKTSHDTTELLTIATVPIDAPVSWLKRGWDDFVSTRFRGVFYGAVFALMGYLVTVQYATQWQLTMGLVSGFFLMGPFICTGLFGLSRQRDRGEPISLLRSLTCWQSNLGSVAFFAIVLTFLMIVWARTSIILFALSSTHTFPTVQGILGSAFSFENMKFVVLWLIVGFIFASIVFAVGVISMPLMLDRNTDTIMAVINSFRALYANPKPLYLWAICIVLIIGPSLLFGFWPLVVTAPVVGHATWHAYTDLLEQ